MSAATGRRLTAATAWLALALTQFSVFAHLSLVPHSIDLRDGSLRHPVRTPASTGHDDCDRERAPSDGAPETPTDGPDGSCRVLAVLQQAPVPPATPQPALVVAVRVDAPCPAPDVVPDRYGWPVYRQAPSLSPPETVA
ncbi:MAG: hypothetical protein QME96_05900 [Myxococcota bacterium]|nr:hypothetical protein [Myxococcota bacterium]